MRISKVYTRTGDGGETSLGGGQRVAKDARRIAAFGTVDELNSVLGVVLTADPHARLAAIAGRIQNELFHLGSDLCILEEDKSKFPVPGIESRHVEVLEREMDELLEELKPLEEFILPGGAPASAQLQVARSVCRRAERELISLRREETIGEQTIPYLNRLSDLLFVMARYENHAKGVPEPQWNKKL